MTVSSVTGTQPQTSTSSQKSGLGALGQGDFLKLMTKQMQMQDPFDPVDNTQMLAQMAQFSQLAGVAEMGETLKLIAAKLDALIAQQNAAGGTTQGGAPASPQS